MRDYKNFEGFILDIDGTVLKNSVYVLLEYALDFIQKYRELPSHFLYSFLKNMTALSFYDSVNFLFKSMGILEKAEEFFEGISSLTQYKGKIIEIDKDFDYFISWCQALNKKILFFSMADHKQKRFKKIFDRFSNNFIDVNNSPKSDFETFRNLITRYNLSPEQWFYVDDTPIALWNAYEAGFITVLPLYSVYEKKDYKELLSHIDFRIESFRDLIKIIKKSFRI